MKKFKYSIFFLFLILLQGTTTSQPSQQWVARYHFYSEDVAQDIAVDDSSNVYVTGWSEALASNGAQPDYATIKYNSTGVLQWVARYNGPGNDVDDARAIAVDDLGNVYVTGLSNRVSFPGNPNYDFATIKYSSSGVQQWVRRYDRGQDQAEAIALDVFGNIYVGGVAGFDLTVIKYNSNGDSLWVRRYDSGWADAFEAMAVDSSGNVYLTGWYNNTFDWQTVKFNSQGVFQWARNYNGPGNGSDYPKSIAVNDSGNVYVTGYVWGNNNTDYATVKYNSSGVQQWVVFYNGGSIQTAHDAAISIAIDDSGNAYVTGASTHPISPTSDWATIKYSSSGVQQWVTRFNGPANSYDEPCCIKLDNNGNVYVTGYATVSLSPNNTDYCTIKYNNSGAQQWVILYNGTGNGSDVASSIAIGSSENVYVTGRSRGPGNLDYATVKYSQTTGIVHISNEIPNEYKLEQNYPNPFNPTTYLRFRISDFGLVNLTVYDILGREIETLVNEELKPGVYEVMWNAGKFTSGVYFYTLKIAGYVETKKMILNK